MITFISGEDLDMATLLTLREKECIIRTAHPGNFDPITVFIAQYFPVILREDILIGADIYEPEFLLSKKFKKLISFSALNTGVAFLRPIQETDILSPIALHYRALTGIFPSVRKGIESLGEEQSLFHILNIVLDKQHSEFDKYYDAHGKKYDLVLSNDAGNEYRLGDDLVFIAKDLLTSLYQNHLRRVQCSYSGEYLEQTASVDVSNSLFHVLLLFCNISVMNKKNIYHLCGDRMYDYFYKDSRFASINQKKLNELFSIVQCALGTDYDINFILVPTKQLRTFLMYKEIERSSEMYSTHSLLKELKNILKKRVQLSEIELKRKSDIINVLIAEDCFTQFDFADYSERIPVIDIEEDFLNTPFSILEHVNKGNISSVKRVRQYGQTITQV